MFGKDVVAAVENRLKEINMSKGEFYKKSGISSATFSQWRTGIYEPSSEALHKIEECIGMTFEISQKNKRIDLFENFYIHSEEKQPSVPEGLSEKDQRLIAWFRSLPEEKQKAILILQGGPEDAL